MLNRMTRWMETVEIETALVNAAKVIGAAGLVALSACLWL